MIQPETLTRICWDDLTDDRESPFPKSSTARQAQLFKSTARPPVMESCSPVISSTYGIRGQENGALQASASGTTAQTRRPVPSFLQPWQFTPEERERSPLDPHSKRSELFGNNCRTFYGGRRNNIGVRGRIAPTCSRRVWRGYREGNWTQVEGEQDGGWSLTTG